MKILFFGTGQGTGSLVKGLSLKAAAARLGGKHEVGLAIGTDYPHLIGGSINDFVRHWKPNSYDLNWLLANVAEQFEPDVIVSCYVTHWIQPWLQSHKVPATLLWRSMKHPAPLVRNLDPETFVKAYRFEKLTTDMLEEVMPGRVEDINPLFPIEPDEMLPRAEAREMLLAAWNLPKTPRKLRVVAHNGMGAEELDALIQETMKLGGHDAYVTVALSQNLNSNGRLLPVPLEKLMLGIDHLVAAPGASIFWSWHHLKRPDAKETWFPMMRGHDPQVIRAHALFEKEWIRTAENGADQIIKDLETLV